MKHFPKIMLFLTLLLHGTMYSSPAYSQQTGVLDCEQVHVYWVEYSDDQQNTGSLMHYDGISTTPILENIVPSFVSLEASAEYIAWVWVSGDDLRLYFWDGEQVTPVTGTAVDVYNYTIYGDSIAYLIVDESTDQVQIYFWQDGTAIPLFVTENFDVFLSLDMDATQVIWSQIQFNDIEHIYRWEGEVIELLSRSARGNASAHVDNGWVVWRTEGLSSEIRLHDANGFIPIPNEIGRNVSPQTNGELVMWRYQAPDSDVWQLRLWDGTEVIELSDDFRLSALSDAQAIWSEGEQVFAWSDGSIRELPIELDSFTPELLVESNYIAWISDADDGDGYDVNFYDGTDTRQLNVNSAGESIALTTSSICDDIVINESMLQANPVVFCENTLPSRVEIDMQAIVTNVDGVPITYSPDGVVYGSVPAGTMLTIISDPFCTDEGIQWQVESVDGDFRGWIPEATEDAYNIAPADAQTDE